jgi:hypothetical protein
LELKLSKLYISILFFSFLASNGEVWGGKKPPKENKNSSKDVPANLEAQIERAREELARLEALLVPPTLPLPVMREIIPVRFTKETAELFSDHPATLDMMKRATYHADADTENFRKLEELFPSIKNSEDQLSVIEGIENNITNHPDTPATEILRNFLRVQNLDQENQEKSQLKNEKSKKIHKEEK